MKDDKKESQIKDEISKEDPFEKAFENEVGNDVGNDSETLQEEHVQDMENTSEALGMGVQDDSARLEQDGEDDWEDDLQDDWGDDSQDDGEGSEMDEEEAEDDPLEGEEGEPMTDAKEYFEDLDMGEDMQQLIEEMGMDAIEMFDDFKVNLCVAIGGGHPSQYAAKPKLQKRLYKSINLVLRHKQFKAPTAGKTLLMVLFMMTVPPLSTALVQKYLLPKMMAKAAPTPLEQAAAEPIDAIDYKATKEYKEGRTRFDTYATTGMYMYKSGEKREYIQVKFADEAPSPEIQKLLEAEKTSAEIKKIVYGS